MWPFLMFCCREPLQRPKGAYNTYYPMDGGGICIQRVIPNAMGRISASERWNAESVKVDRVVSVEALQVDRVDS
jgi:hypothetical protein